MIESIHEGVFVQISLKNNPAKYSEGEVYKILSKNSSKTRVILKNGDSGTVIKVIDSIPDIKKRIMKEDQHTENKDKFGEPTMCDEVIPKTVQSFLNSDGGYLYIGIRDIGELQDKLLGLDYDFDLIRTKHPDAKIDELCDILVSRIVSSLDKNLTSDAVLGELLEISFPEIHGITIAEITIKKSPHPWFFKHKTKNNKEKTFQIYFQNELDSQRILDDFYIRNVNGKKRLDTMKEFYDYAKNRFATFK